MHKTELFRAYFAEFDLKGINKDFKSPNFLPPRIFLEWSQNEIPGSVTISFSFPGSVIYHSKGGTFNRIIEFPHSVTENFFIDNILCGVGNLVVFWLF